MKIHIVKQGDTLYALSQKYGVPLEKIIEANPQFSNPNTLSIGDKVKIPAAPLPVQGNSDVYYKHTVKQGDTLWKLSKAWGVPLKEVIDANPQLKNPNALLVGEVVNIPKKTTVSPLSTGNVSPAQSSNAAAEKTQFAGKTYTGPKEQPPKAVSPVAEAPPAPVANVNPNPNPVPVPVIEPTPAPAPVAVAPIAEVVPMKETIHTESQSLFVQISVPAQEAVSYHEAPKSEHKPVAHAFEEKKEPCDNFNGYPGLSENPHFYNSPQQYPFYEAAPNMNFHPNGNFVQPAYEPYVPECPPMYYYPEWVSPVAENQNPWQSNVSPLHSVPMNAAPNMNINPATINTAPTNVGPINASPNQGFVSGAHPNSEFHGEVSPQYDMHPQNLPWPPCGCEGGAPIHPYQSFSYGAPDYNSEPMFAHPNAVSPYGAGGPFSPNQGIVPNSPLGAFGGPGLSNIPPNPQYPGVGEYAHHSRLPEIQSPELFMQEDSLTTIPVSEATLEGAVERKTTQKKAAVASKAKTSGQNSKSNKTSARSQRSSKGSRNENSKKRRNPWISN